MASNLDAVLNKHGIVRKAYHGRSFVGNHCKKYLQPQVFGDNTSSVPKTALQLVSHHEILTKAEIIHQKFGQLFDLFSTVDSLLSHDLPVAETTIPKTDKAISDYIKFFSQEFPWRKHATKTTHFGTSLFCLGPNLGLWNVSDGGTRGRTTSCNN